MKHQCKACSSRESNRRNATPQSDEVNNAANPDRQTPDTMRITPNSDSLMNLGATSRPGSVEDDAFFQGLPVLIQEVTDKLSHLLMLEAESIAVGDLPCNPPAAVGITTVPDADPGLETVRFCALRDMIRIVAPLQKEVLLVESGEAGALGCMAKQMSTWL
jgi:hypothetical protein